MSVENRKTATDSIFVQSLQLTHVLFVSTDEIPERASITQYPSLLLDCYYISSIFTTQVTCAFDGITDICCLKNSLGTLSHN